jgi:hypothetical protein
MAFVGKKLGQTLGPKVNSRSRSKKATIFHPSSERVAKTHFTKKEKCTENTISPILHALSRGSFAHMR